MKIKINLWLRAYYFILLTRIYFSLFNGWHRYRTDIPSEPLWPLQLLSAVPHKFIVDGCFYLFFVGCFVCVVRPLTFWARLAAFLGLFFAVAISSSYGKVIHGYHGWIFSSLVLILLPSAKHKKEEAMAGVIAGSQFVTTIPYVMAGLWKIRGGIECVSRTGLECIQNSFVHALAWEYSQYNFQPSTWVEPLIRHPLLSSLPFIGIVYLQLFSPVLALRPSTHLFFGTSMVLFHVISDVVLKIPFNHQLALVALMFLASPFYKFSNPPLGFIKDLPILRLFIMIFRKHKTKDCKIYGL